MWNRQRQDQLRINPVNAYGQNKYRREASRPGKPETPSGAISAERLLPVAVEPVCRTEPSRHYVRYRPDAAFLAHLIATRDGDPQTRFKRTAASEYGADRYRQTAASPRKRAAGHVIVASY